MKIIKMTEEQRKALVEKMRERKAKRKVSNLFNTGC